MSRCYFTAKAVESFKPGTQQQDYRDSHLAGFELRVSPGGTKTFNYVYRHHGRQRRLKIGRYPDLSLADARRRAEEARGQLAKGIDPAAAKDATRNSGTFRELSIEFMEKYSKPNKRTWAEDQRMINKDFLPAWGSRQLLSITSREIREQLERIAKRGRRGIVANHCLSLLRTMFDFAVERDLMEVNPCSRMKRPVKTNVRERVLTPAEIKTVWALLDSCDVLQAAILRVQLLTAQRVGEVMSMKWADVDLEGGWWTIPGERAKNGHAHRVPLSVTVVEILKKRELATKSDFVFPAPRDRDKPVLLPTVQRTVVRLRQSVSFTTHDLRRTAATSLSRMGASRVLLKRILNHRDLDITARYDHHSYDWEAKIALENWGREVRSMVDGVANSSTVIPFAVNG